MDSALTSLTHEAPANLVVTMIIVPILQWVKQSNLPIMRLVNERTVFVVSGLIAAIAAIGIHVSYDPAADLGTITWSLAGLIGGTAEWIKQFAAQHWGHRALRAFEALPKALEALGTLADDFEDPAPHP